MLAKHNTSYKGEGSPCAVADISAIQRRKQLNIFSYIADFKTMLGIFL